MASLWTSQASAVKTKEKKCVVLLEVEPSQFEFRLMDYVDL
jgi:hypothetical protein